METSLLILLVNVVSTLYMFGLIWMVQVVHYPLFNAVGTDQFVVYQRRHMRLTTFVVGPPMLLEAFSSVLLLWFPLPNVSIALVSIGVAMIFVIWLSTAFAQVPCHQKLESGFNSAAHRWLVTSNWVRTLAWTARAGIVTWMLVLVLNITWVN